MSRNVWFEMNSNANAPTLKEQREDIGGEVSEGWGESRVGELLRKAPGKHINTLRPFGSDMVTMGTAVSTGKQVLYSHLQGWYSLWHHYVAYTVKTGARGSARLLSGEAWVCRWVFRNGWTVGSFILPSHYESSPFFFFFSHNQFPFLFFSPSSWQPGLEKVTRF